MSLAQKLASIGAVACQGGADAYWRWVAMCEDGGVDSVWQTDRLVSEKPFLERMSAMAALAGATKRLKFGMNVVSVGLRDPLLLAKQCATIDMLSNGGTFVEIGDIVRGKEVSIDPSKLLTGKNIVGSLMYKPELLPRLLNFLVRKQDTLPFDKIVSHTFPLAEVNDAFVQAEWDQSQTPITRAMLVP